MPRLRTSHCLQWLFFVFTGALLLSGCQRDASYHQLAGSTMGTSWSLTYSSEAEIQAEQIQGILEGIEQSMSTWRSDSEISQFNRLTVGEWQQVSPDFIRVMLTAQTIWQASAGAYDVTVAPLVNLWGFGPGERRDEPPPAEQLSLALARVGSEAIEVDEASLRIRKTSPRQLDFSSLAKGYAVDRVAQWLVEQGIDNFLVEVGGEMRLAGNSPRGDLWRIAIEKPEVGMRAVESAIAITGQAVATSGDYRNFFEYRGQRYSHSIDPRTGLPVAHDLVSVTVVHPSAMLADAWATALTVMGTDAALAMAQQHNLAVYLISREGEGFDSDYTAAFTPYLETEAEAQ